MGSIDSLSHDDLDQKSQTQHNYAERVKLLPALTGVWESHEADASGVSLFSCLTALMKQLIRVCLI